MAELILKVGEQELRQIEHIAQSASDAAGGTSPISVDQMALALLQAHLILIRDCGGVLPDDVRKPAHGAEVAPQPVKIVGKGGVSLSGGISENY
ncbi:hypothetical protein SAMN05444149_10886 [Pseudosulfitobacter pseudonitzschiae]|uniref:Uncharacterized protein n=1 Tax=Pseudosulfitobacter pseudonitzschiae TaxID=1402135 RepID=A0A073IW09_9RHOB|nr:hypothetical protein [Pseudosulfitobacter pseudonitzschiae]KEJ93969.1 hypothetical protein SUH3_11910 [Pseudosulfitobacter pseudonitzschiae]SHG01225.1 hypothetical protein SAMN05444149_10886 [Pseudosulfitobacter pseudonitzschiae]